MNSPLFSAICCPVGAVAQNGICYCTEEQSLSHPFACRVICENLIPSLPPTRGGCQCKKGYAGTLCDLEPCYVQDHVMGNIKLYCQNAQNQYFDCTNETNLGAKENVTEVYDPCPCLNQGLKVLRNITDQIYSCLCPSPYSGDLCQTMSKTQSDTEEEDQVTANTFLAIIAISLLIVTVTICCCRRYRHRKKALAEAEHDCHRHYRPEPLGISLLSYGHQQTQPLIGGKVEDESEDKKSDGRKLKLGPWCGVDSAL